jgi:hypothetical protein
MHKPIGGGVKDYLAGVAELDQSCAGQRCR